MEYQLLFQAGRSLAAKYPEISQLGQRQIPSGFHDAVDCLLEDHETLTNMLQCAEKTGKSVFDCAACDGDCYTDFGNVLRDVVCALTYIKRMEEAKVSELLATAEFAPREPQINDALSCVSKYLEKVSVIQLIDCIEPCDIDKALADLKEHATLGAETYMAYSSGGIQAFNDWMPEGEKTLENCDAILRLFDVLVSVVVYNAYRYNLQEQLAILQKCGIYDGNPPRVPLIKMCNLGRDNTVFHTGVVVALWFRIRKLHAMLKITGSIWACTMVAYIVENVSNFQDVKSNSRPEFWLSLDVFASWLDILETSDFVRNLSTFDPDTNTLHEDVFVLKHTQHGPPISNN